MKRKISSATDVVGVVLPSLTMHECVQLPVPTPIPGPTLELDVVLAHPPGATTHALAVNVKHRGIPVVLAGHDCGMGIVHITMLPLPDPLGPLHILLSSRKVVFAAALVRGEKTPLALTGGDLLSPMLVCGTVPAPLGVNSTNALASVDIGVTPADIAVSFADIGIETIETLLAELDNEMPSVEIDPELIARALPIGIGIVLLPVNLTAGLLAGGSSLAFEMLVERDDSGGYRTHPEGAMLGWFPRSSRKRAEQPDWSLDPSAGSHPSAPPFNPGENADEPPL